jgi:PAS domain S-box-containing protein
MGKLIQSTGWSATALGPIESWPHSLRTTIRLILNSRYPMFVWWGRELTNFYNDAYIPVLGARHPQALGQPAARVWAEIWNVVGPQSEIVMREGRATWNESILLVMERYGYTEETYFTFSYSPATDDEGRVGGVFCACIEDTKRVLSERRLRTLRALAEQSAAAKSAEEACITAAATMRDNPYDLPFALLYLIDAGGTKARLVAATMTENFASPAVIELGNPVAAWAIDQVIESGESQIVNELESIFGQNVKLPGGVWPEPVRQAVTVPMARAGQIAPSGFLIAGVSPRLVLDDDYRGFLKLTAGHVGNSIANARAYEEERKRAEALAEIDRAKTTFFTNISHEFRTPLTLMLAPTEDALAETDDPKQRERLELVHRNALRLQKLVNTLLDFSRIEAGRIQACYEPTDLATVTNDLASAFRSAVERVGMRLVVNCPPLAAPVFVDREMWEKIVLNLVSNAFKFTLAGEIEVSLRELANKVELTVRDTGAGIAEEQLAHIFERFHRVEGAQVRAHEGTGIGLALVQELVKLHGGTISVESIYGNGTSFTVAIPKGAAHLRCEQIEPFRNRPSTAVTSSHFLTEAHHWSPAEDFCLPSTLPVSRSRVLVADDNADMRDYIARLLSDRYHVRAVADGEAALAAIRREFPDLVLADIMMPRLDGFQLIRELRANPRTAATPVILLSARAGEEAKVEGMNAGADDYLVKPFSAKELLARVEGHLKLQLARRQAEQAVRQRTAQFETLLNEAPLGVYLVDAEFRIREVNPTALRVFGNIPDLIGRDFDEVIGILWPKSYADEIVRLFRHTLDTGEPYITSEQIRQRVDRGVTEFYEWQINRIPLPDGGYGVVCYFRDISTQVFARQKIAESEERFRTLADNMSQLAWMADSSGWIFWYNQRWFDYTGTTLEEMQGWGWKKAHHPNHVDRVVARIQYSWNTGELWEDTFPLRGKDGKYRWFLSRAVPIRNGEGSVVRWFGTNTDVTDEKKAQAVADAQKEAFELAISGASINEALNPLVRTAQEQSENGVRTAIFIADAEGARLRFAAAAGISESYTRAVDGFVIGPESPSCGTAAFTGQTVIVRDTAQDPSWAPYLELAREHGICACWSFPIRSFGGKVLGSFAVYHRSPQEPDARDSELFSVLAQTAAIVIERYKVAEERQRAEETLREADRRKDEFIAMLGHELRNPLGIIGNAVQLLHRLSGAEAQFADVRDMIERQVTHTSRMLDDLLDVSRISHGKIQLNKQPWDLRDIAYRSAEDYQNAMDENGLRLELNIAEQPLRIEADRTRLAQALGNLLHNACKFTQPGGTVRMTVAAENQTCAILKVCDNGMGLDPDALGWVFEPFSQADRSLERSGGGLGLGLSLVKGIVEMHGGDVTAASDGPGHGAEFTIRLPLDQSYAKASTAKSASTDAHSPRRILIIEDNPIGARSMRMFLELAGHTVEVAHNGLTGIEAARRFRPEVVLCDIGLPGMDGYGVAQALRKEPGLNGSLLIAVSGYAQDEQRHRGEAGFNAHIMKPVEFSKLKELLAQLSANNELRT